MTAQQKRGQASKAKVIDRPSVWVGCVSWMGGWPGKKDWAVASESVALECLDFDVHRKQQQHHSHHSRIRELAAGADVPVVGVR